MTWGTNQENAVHQWVVTMSQLPAESVIWQQQDGPRPASPCITMRCASVSATGIDWTVYAPAPVPAPLQDAVYTVQGPRTAQLYMQCYGAPVGDTSAVVILERVRSSIRLPSVRTLLGDANIGIGSSSTIINLGTAQNTIYFEPRAYLEFQLHLTAEISELGPVIESVITSNEVEA